MSSKTKTRPQTSKTARQTAAMKRGLKFLETAGPTKRQDQPPHVR